jgi:hypothetical protein
MAEFVEVRAANFANKNKSEEAISDGTRPQENSAVPVEDKHNLMAEAAGKPEESETDGSASAAAMVSDDAIRASDLERIKLLEEKIQIMDEEIKRLHKENQRLQKLQLDDTWLDGWNAQIFKCTDCERPFGTQTRLLDHRKTWHSASSSKIEEYEKAVKNSRLDGMGHLKEIFKGGDLILKTRKWFSGTAGYLVSSQVLCMTSKVFLKMMGRDSHFKEATDVRRANVLGFQPAVVTVDDDYKALEFVLQVLHHRYDMLPIAPPVFHELVRMAEICDKYELQQALKPTLDRFLEPYKTRTGMAYGDWLLISYVFGYADIFSQISKEVILTSSWMEHSLRFRLFEGALDSRSLSLSECTPSSITGA